MQIFPKDRAHTRMTLYTQGGLSDSVVLQTTVRSDIPTLHNIITHELQACVLASRTSARVRRVHVVAHSLQEAGRAPRNSTVGVVRAGVRGVGCRVFHGSALCTRGGRSV